jgi:uncharacterized RDD family membrane protein YckC
LGSPRRLVHDGCVPEPPPRRTPAARLLGAGARGAERFATATGIDAALEDALEEAIVRALRSPAVERAVVRVIQQNAVQDAISEALTSDEVADAIIKALDSEIADRVWADLLASQKAQMLVERIAEAPEVRAAITQQGAGLITDVGRRLTVLTEALDDALEKVVHRLLRRAGGSETETDEAGLLTRALAAGIDFALLTAAYSLASGLLASVLPFAFGHDKQLPLWAVLVLSIGGFLLAGGITAAFWALVGQTPGMRFLSIRLDVDGTGEIGVRRAVRRLIGVLVAVIPAGLGFLAILVSPARRGWHDRIAGTKVVYDRARRTAPHSQR